MKNTAEKWPVRYKDMLLTHNPDSNIGIVCHWTHKNIIAEGIKNYACLGQLYSKDIGISSIIRNVLAHPHIDTLILCGNEGRIEETKSSKALLNLLNNGVDDNHNIHGTSKAKIEKEIPVEYINLFRSRLKYVNLIGINDTDKIQQAINNNFSENPKNYEIYVFPEPEKTENLELPSESAVFVVRKNTVSECWLDILKNIMIFGKIKGSQYGERQKEIIDLVSIVENEDLEKPNIPCFMNLTEKQINDYIPTIITADNKVPGVKYTYGERLRNYKGIDQIRNIINQISKTPFSRRAVACTWNVEMDSESENPPCLDIVQVLVQNQKLSLTVYIRSNDMFLGWPENAFGVLALQDLIIRESNELNSQNNLEKGPIIIISSSAHIYERNWEEAKKIISENDLLSCAWDPRGNFIIDISDGLIKVYNTNDPQNLKWEGKTASDIIDKIIFYVSIMPHAAYLGKELMKAEIALNNNFKYIQDLPL